MTAASQVEVTRRDQLRNLITIYFFLMFAVSRTSSGARNLLKTIVMFH